MIHETKLEASRQWKPAMVAVRDKLERALRNAQSAHLDQKDLRALIAGGVLDFISSLASKEIAKCLEDEVRQPSGPVNSGSNGETTAVFGKLPGMTGEELDEHAASAASRRALSMVEQVKAHRRRP